MSEFYNCKCPDCGGDTPKRLVLSATENNKLQKAFNKVARWAFDSKLEHVTPDDLNNKKVQGLTKEINSVLLGALSDGVRYEIPESMMQHYTDNVYVFSGCKTYAELREISSLLRNEHGDMKSFSKFFKEVQTIHDDYNKAYLESEYIYAQQSAIMSSKWLAFEKDGDEFNLQYRTANDDRVRYSHQVLHNTTLPPSDPFWSKFFPPNGWRCRCNTVQVRVGRYPLTDSTTANDNGNKATYTIGKGRVNTSAMFRFNAGKQKIIFPPHHPYFKNKEVIKVIQEQRQTSNALINLKEMIKGDEPTNNEVKKILSQYAELSPDDFRRGLDKVSFAKSKSYLMQHSMSYKPSTKEWVRGSNISISTHDYRLMIGDKVETFNPANELKGAFSAIKRGEALTFKQEYSIESLWHEILHAKTKTKPSNLGRIGTQNMETVNQFVARHTYDKFLNAIGGQATHKEKILSDGLGYKSYVAKFRKLLHDCNIDEAKAVEALQPKLMEDYSTIGQETNKFINENRKKD